MLHHRDSLICTCLWVSCIAVSATAYSGGTGEPNDPYQIAGSNDWDMLVTTPADLSMHFVLTADIDFGGAPISSIDAGDSDKTEFSGTLDGQGHTLSNFSIAARSVNKMAIINRLKTGGAVRNLGVRNLTLTMTGDTADQPSYMGAIVAENHSGATIQNCTVDGLTLTGTHSVTGQYGLFGGIAGANHGNITGCVVRNSTLNVTTLVAGTRVAVGSIVGYQTGSPSGTAPAYVADSSAVDCNIACAMNMGGTPCYVGGAVGAVISSGADNSTRNYVSGCSWNGTIAVTSSTQNARLYVGGVVGGNLSTILQSNATGKIIVSNTGASSTCHVGGICGQNYMDLASVPSTAARCWSNCDINVSATDSHAAVGGAFGSCYPGTAADCYSLGSLREGNEPALRFQNGGGFVGLALQTTITNCFCTMEPFSVGQGKPADHVVMAFGNLANTTATGCFWNKTLTNWGTDTDGVTGMTTSQMKTASTFAAWDMTDTWTICQGTNYPRLRWQVDSMDWVCPDGIGFEDLAWLADRWLADTCTPANSYCQAADTDHSGKVTFADFATLASRWMQ